MFKDLSRTNILLIHSERILEKNDSPTDNILEGDYIIIIQDKYYPDDEYFMQLKEKTIKSNGEKINIILKDETKIFVKSEIIPKNISILTFRILENFGQDFLWYLLICYFLSY